MTPDWPTIQSEGPPPERHADRIVAEMVRWMHDEGEKFMPQLQAMLKRAELGSPKAQDRFIERRLFKSGMPALLGAGLKPGKRGKFNMDVWWWEVPDPERPQIAVRQFNITGLSRFAPREVQSTRFFLVSHHALSRLAQRAGVRTPLDLHDALLAMLLAVADAMKAKTWPSDQASPPEGWRLPFKGGIAVLHRDGKAFERDMVVATVLPEDGQPLAP